MRGLALIIAPLLVATPVQAQHQGHPMPAPADVVAPPDDMAAMDHGAMDGPVGSQPPPPVPTDFAADRIFGPPAMKAARDVLYREHSGGGYSKVMLSLGEVQLRDGESGYRWEGEAWYGGDLNRLVFKTEGAGDRSGVEDAEIQVLYSRAIGPYFDLQAGVRQDLEPRPRRTYATVGVEGLAPYGVETSAALFLSNHGDLLGRLEAAWDMRLTQRWILQPRIETSLAARDVPELGVGSGVSNVELGLRLRYEIRREFAPYIGLSFDRGFGRTAGMTRAAGGEVETTSLVLGVRGWF
ncbi:MAG: copper resistance protein B [Caulobacter sp.]|nr:copper resistance protein B [Caulobacter sp.]